MKRTVTLFATLVMTLFAGTAWPQVTVPGCPTALDTLTNWYETSPDIGQVSQINMVLTFTNGSGVDVQFSAVAEDTMQLWTTPSVDDPLPVYNSAPSGTVANGANFSYDITIDTANMAASEAGFGIRPSTINLGNIGPNSGRSVLVSATFDCIAGNRIPQASSIPSSSEWSIIILLLLVIASSSWALRKSGFVNRTAN